MTAKSKPVLIFSSKFLLQNFRLLVASKHDLIIAAMTSNILTTSEYNHM